MWCNKCRIQLLEDVCPICGSKTEPVVPIEVNWCDHCHIPLIHLANDLSMDNCPICNRTTSYLASDLRPVFPEERLLLELLLDVEPYTYANNSVWAANSRYYIDGKPVSISTTCFRDADTRVLREKLDKFREGNPNNYFQNVVSLFVKANAYRLNNIIEEASSFIKDVSTGFSEEQIVLSFSGGKDSTVTADIVTKTLGNPSLVHIFGDTTLEFPLTYEYADRFSKEHPDAIFIVSRNNEQSFYDVCEDIGPPARMMRWCCSMFKTGPITRVLNGTYEAQQILTFYGIRRYESVSRSKYSRVTSSTENVKIQKQTVAAPIFDWKDIDVWLYLLSEKVDFNDAYRLGYDRVGCWCCPNNNARAQFLSRIYMPEESEKWRAFLIDFAKRIGKPDPEVYVDSGKWKARQGGNGLKAANDVKIKFTNCTAEDHAKIYNLTRPFDDSLIGMFVPFGIIAKELGRKLINETIILDVRTKVPIISIQPFSQDGYDYAVKIKTMNVANHEDLQRMIGYQIRKFNACRKCLKCESLCKAGAISIIGDDYYIDPEKCVHCKKCVSAKYLDGGCMMDKYLKTKD